MKAFVINLLLCTTLIAQEQFEGKEVDLSTNVVLQVTPQSTNDAPYFTMPPVGSMTVSNTIAMTAYVGLVFRLTWYAVTNVTYAVEKSTNQTAWTRIPMRFQGANKTIVWYENRMVIGTNNYFRLIRVSAPPKPAPPKNLRKVN